MRISTSLLAALATATGVAAQIPSDQANEHVNYQTNTSYTTRSGVAGSSDGWIVNKTSSDLVRGVCQFVDPADGILKGRCLGFFFVIQDQSGITQEPFGYGWFADAALAGGTAGEPKLPDATDVLAAGALGAFDTSATTPVSTATGAVAWGFTTTFATPSDDIPQTGDVYCGVKIPANASWVSDGVSFHAPFFTGGTNGDNPSANAVNNGSIYSSVWSNDLTADPTGSTLNTPLADRIQNFHMRGPGLALRVGADIDPTFSRGPANPNYGFGGLYPDHVNRIDGLAFKVQDANLNGITATYGIVGSFPDATGAVFGNFPLPLRFGALYAGDLHVQFGTLLNFDWYFGTGANQAGGVVDNIMIPYGVLPSGALGTLAFQAVAFGLDPVTVTPFIKASNAVAFNSL